MGNTQGLENGPTTGECVCGRPGCRNANMMGSPEAFMRMLNMVGKRTNPWKEKAQTVGQLLTASVVPDANTDELIEAISKFRPFLENTEDKDGFQAIGYLLVELLKNFNEETRDTAIPYVQEIFGAFLTRITVRDGNQDIVSEMFEALSRAGLTSECTRVYQHFVTIYEGDVEFDDLAILAETAVVATEVAIVRGEEWRSEQATQFTELFISKVNWREVDKSTPFRVLANILYATSYTPAFEPLFNICWQAVELTTASDREDDTQFAAIGTMIKTISKIISKADLADDQLLKVHEVLDRLQAFLFETPGDKRYTVLGNTLMYQATAMNYGAIRRIMEFLNKYPLAEEDSFKVHTNAFTGAVIVHCGKHSIPADDESIRTTMRNALIAATTATEFESNQIMEMLSHVATNHSEFIPYLVEQITFMYRTNSASPLTTNIFAAVVAPLIIKSVCHPEGGLTDEQITNLVNLVRQTPWPWSFKSKTACIAMMIIPVLTLKIRLPQVHASYMNWVVENLEHFQIYKERIQEAKDMCDEHEETRAIFNEGLEQFLELLE
jgi:hypothetical protein